MAVMTSFRADKCCRLASEKTASAGAYAAAPGSSWSIVHSYLLTNGHNSNKLCNLRPHNNYAYYVDNYSYKIAE